MELSAALAADLTNLTQALDDRDTDLAQTVQQFVAAARGAVPSYLGMSITTTTAGRQVHLTALEDSVEAHDILTSLRVPLEVADPGPAMELILYAGTPGALVDLCADLSWLTGRELGDFVLDAHLVVPDHRDELARTSWVNQAIGVLIGRGYTPQDAAHQIDLLPTRTEQDRRRSAEHVHPGLRPPDPQAT